MPEQYRGMYKFLVLKDDGSFSTPPTPPTTPGPVYRGQSRFFVPKGEGTFPITHPAVPPNTYRGRSKFWVPFLEGGCISGITDTFTRTVEDGWGTSDSGLPWGVSGWPEFSVADGYGTVAANNIQFDMLRFDQVCTLDCLMHDISLVLPGVSYFSLQFDQDLTSSYYIWWPGDGSFEVWTDLGGTSIIWPIDLTHFNMRIHGDSSGLQVKIWALAEAEPDEWTISQEGSESDPYDAFYYVLGVDVRSGLTGSWSG